MTFYYVTAGAYSRKNVPLHPSTVRRVLNTHFAYLSYGRTTNLGVCMECEDFAARKAWWKSIGSETGKAMEWLQAAKDDFVEFQANSNQHKQEHEAERGAFDGRVKEVVAEPRKKILATMDYTKSKQAMHSMSGTKVRRARYTLTNIGVLFSLFLGRNRKSEIGDPDGCLGSVRARRALQLSIPSRPDS